MGTCMNLYGCTWIYVNYKYEFFILPMNLYEFIWIERTCAAVRRSAAVRQCERCKWQCVAVRTVVCAQCLRQCAAVFFVVYDSAHGSVLLSGSAAVCSSVRQCAAARQCAAVCGSAAVRVRQCGSVRHCVAVRQCVAVCGSAHGSVWQYALRIYTQSRSQYILVCPFRGGGNEPHHIPSISILTDQYTSYLYELKWVILCELIWIDMN